MSNYGRIKKLPNIILNNKPNSKGYIRVVFTVNGKRKSFAVHRLVAEAFIPNPNNLPEVNHKDENKSNNSVNNLEWCTRSYNNNYGTRNRRVAEKEAISIVQLDFKRNLIRKWNSIREASRELNIKSSIIVGCCKKQYKSGKGFIWEYETDYNKSNESNIFEFKYHAKPIVQLTLLNEVIKVWVSYYQINNESDIFHSRNVVDCCKHKQNTAHGYKWMYLNEFQTLYGNICNELYDKEKSDYYKKSAMKKVDNRYGCNMLSALNSF